MSMLFQFGALFTDLTVFENVAFPLREHTHLPESMIRDLVLMKLEAVGMRGAHRLMPAQLSGGMARRAALARAVVLDPMLVLYDEPFAGLDPIALAVIGQLIRKAERRARRHLDPGLARRLRVPADRRLPLLRLRGRIVGEGTPDEVRASTDPFVRQFVHGETDGPVPFHVQARPYAADVGLAPRAARA
jgi:phospholipid/cholesterol/gamma-HCH transport system ATP-binding protein